MLCRLERTFLYMLPVQFIVGFFLIFSYHVDTSYRTRGKLYDDNILQSVTRRKTTRENNVYNISLGVRIKSECTNIQFPLHLVSKDVWFAVEANRLDLVFSAYYDEFSAMIVVIGARKRQYNKGIITRSVICQLWFQAQAGHITMEEQTAVTKDISETHGRPYSATKFTCYVPSRKKPTFVSIVSRRCGVPSNLLQVQLSSPPKQYNRTFTVCLSPLNFNYNRTYELVEWIELNRLLGAERFTIYNYSSAENVKAVLDYYSGIGVVDVVQWEMPIRVKTNDKDHPPDIHYYGQLVALQECLFRNKHESEFVVNLDLDEFIIPRQRKSTTWTDMLKGRRNNTGAFIFRNTFFKKEWEDTSALFPEKSLAMKYHLVTLLKTNHEVKISPHRQRSKYIARTSKVDRLMIHDVPILTGNEKADLVPMETALLHHYRNWYQYNDKKSVKIKDDIVVHKYASSLTGAVEHVWRQLPKWVVP